MDLSGLKFGSSSSYTIVGEIGRGGMGIVLLAEKNSEGVADLVALKTIRTKSADHETRLKQEANIATGLRHENIVKTYGMESIPFGQLPAEFIQGYDTLSSETGRRLKVGVPRALPAGRFAVGPTKFRISPPTVMDRKIYLIVMDYIEGTDLRTFQNEHVKRDLLVPVPLAAFAVSRVARALAYAHQSIVHRDISPENVLMSLQGVVKLSDFGVAVLGEAGGIAGKLPYLSPEQIGGKEVDLRTDLYSLGLVLFLLLTGVSLQRVPPKMPIAERLDFLRKLLDRPFLAPGLVRNDVPEELSMICMKMLARDPARRYASAEDVVRDLEQKYLYARGFGPTNNSMQAYLEMFDASFKETTQEQLRQLPFLHGQVQRPLSASLYTREGKALLEETMNR